MKIAAALIVSCVITYLLTMRYVAMQGIEQSGWESAFHKYRREQIQ